MENNQPTSRCRCIFCGQKFEFPTDLIGSRVNCPSCKGAVLLKAAYQPARPPGGKHQILESKPAHIAAAAAGLLIVCGVFAFSLYWSKKYPPNNGATYTPPSHEAGVKTWEDSLRRSDKWLYGTKTATDEEIHRDAEMFQHEQEQGITPAGMLERELDGRHNAPPK